MAWFKARGSRGAKPDCKSVFQSSILSRASKPTSKYASLADMHWFWRYVYWPLRRLCFRHVEYPMIQHTNAFLKPLRAAQDAVRNAEQERDQWKAKAVALSKEISQLKRGKL